MNSFKLVVINILVYLLTLLIFIIEKNNLRRFTYGLLLYFLFCFNIGIKIKNILVYLVISVVCVLTESIFVNFFDETWEYKNPDILGIPYWLIPIWSIAIILVVQINEKL